MVNWQCTQIVTAPSTSSATWGVDAHIFPNPVGFASLLLHDDAPTSVASSSIIVNPQLANSTANDAQAFETAVNTLEVQYERWRMAFGGVTVYLDAPALSDQGSCIAAQYPATPISCGGGYQVGPPGYVQTCNIKAYQDADFPQFSELQAMPNAYSGQAREGCYMPLILDSNHAQWRTPADDFLELVIKPADEYDTKAEVEATGQASLLYPGITNYHQVLAAMPTGTRIPMMATDIHGCVSFRNIAKGARLTFVFRYGFECMTQPNSVSVPFLKMSPAYDEQAISAYYLIRREMKDAYPSDYNDLQEIWNVIKGVADFVSPAFSEVVKAPARMFGSYVDGWFDKRNAQKTNPRDKSPAASAERTQAAQAVAMTTPAQQMVVSARKRIGAIGQPRRLAQRVQFPKRR